MYFVIESVAIEARMRGRFGLPWHGRPVGMLPSDNGVSDLGARWSVDFTAHTQGVINTL